MTKTVKYQTYQDGNLDVELIYTGNVNQVAVIYADLAAIRDKFSERCPKLNDMEHDVSFLKEDRQKHTYSFEVPKNEADNVKNCLRSLGF